MTMATATITKSLHTVTAVTNVARYLNFNEPVTGLRLAQLALSILGYDYGTEHSAAELERAAKSDVTLARIIRECNSIVGGA
jgi:hypothetical protein